MKKALLLSLFLSMILVSQNSKAQGMENFANYGETSNIYNDSTFLGQDGSTWHYYQCRGDSVIEAPTPTMGKARTPISEITSGPIAGGCGVLSFQYKQVFATDVSLDVYVNGLLVKTVTTFGEQGAIKNSGSITVNASGSFVIGLKQTNNTTSGQVAVDNITWTGFSGGPLPEPTDYPTVFTATPGGYKVKLTWTDAAGTQAPTAYLIKASIADNITSPVDGIPEADAPAFVSGKAAMNVLQGVHTYTFTGLPVNVPYFFKIFPYTNSGALINFKTDGTVPSATATTPNLSVISQTNFDDFTFGGWTAFSVTGDLVWVVDSVYGYSPLGCAKMTGYFSGVDYENEDWLISPALDFDHSTNEVLSFMNAYKYTGNPIEVKISTDYVAASNPNTATWTNLTAILSAGNFVYISSGDIDVSAATGANVRIGFKFTSTATASSTWELDDILVTGIRPVGLPEKTIDELSIFPNPSKGIVNLKFNNTGGKQIEVYSILGNSVYNGTTTHGSAQIDLSDLNKGIYFVKISDQNGSNQITKKLILQ